MTVSSFNAMLTERSAWYLFLEVLNMALSATWIMLAVILFRALLKRHLPRRIVIWGWALVAFRLVCPISVESALSLIPSAEPVPLDIPYAVTPALNLGVPAVETPINSMIASSLTPHPGDSINPMQVVTAIATLLWILGVLGLWIYTLLSYVRLRRRVRTATKAQGGEALPLRATLWQSEHVDSPFILGFFSPRVYVPYGLDAETAAHMLAHESAHLKRLDHIAKFMAFLVCAVYWFHPLVWVCYILYCRDMEAACDERVVKDMDDTARRAYARALLSCEGSRKPRPFCPPAFGETDVKSRIKGVLSYKKPLLWIVIAAILALAVLGVFLLTDPVEKYENIPSDWYGISHVTETICDERGFSMIPEDFIWENGRITGIRMRFENNTAYDIGYGEPFRIYRDNGLGWEDVAVTDDIFLLPMYYIPAGGEVTHFYNVTGYDLSVHARYRFVISIETAINEYGATTSREAYIYFTVSGGEALASPHPADFAIHFESQIGDVPNVLDTFDGYIQKDLVFAIPNKAKTNYEPSKAELQYLWYLVEAYGIMNMPSDMHAVQTGAFQVSVEPNTEYLIKIRANGRIYTVRGDAVTGMVEGDRNARFKSFVGHVYNFMVSTGQWKSLPQAQGGYD